jgi:hypothetical protein
MRLAFFTLAILTLALVAAPSVSAQGAMPSYSSFTEPAEFTDVSCLADADSKPAHGLLSFDALSQVRCKSPDGAGFSIPYTSVTRLVFHENEKTDTTSRFSFHDLLPTRDKLKTALTAERYLTIYYKDTEGHTRSAVVRIDAKNWQMVLAVAENKTGLAVQENDKGTNWNWTGAW